MGSFAGKIALYVFDEERTKVLSREPIIVRLGSKAAHKIIINVEPPVETEPLPDTIEGLRKGLGLKIPGSLVGYLERSGIKTLADIRRMGGLGQDPALPIPANEAAVRMLDSLAALTLLPTDIKTNAGLVSIGFGD